jgi:hyperosmotically inducible periplasmic protein
VANHRQDGGRDGALPEEDRSTRSTQAQTQSLSHPSRGNVSDDHRWWRDRNYRDDDRHDDDQVSDLVPRRWAGGRDDVESTGYRSGRSAGDRGFGAGPEGAPGRGDAPRNAGPGDLGYHATGPHRGKGPVGYRRSDERIHELVCEALADDDQLDASQIVVSVTSSDVTLSGVVDDRHAKLEAEDCAYSVSGVRDVQNQLSVTGDPPPVTTHPAWSSAPAYGWNRREQDPLAGGRERDPSQDRRHPR